VFNQQWESFKQSEMYRNYINPTKYSDKLEEQFDTQSREEISPLIRLTIVISISLLLVAWISDFYRFADKPKTFRYFFIFRSFTITTGIFAYILLLSDWGKKRPSTIFIGLLVVAEIVTGYCFSQLGSPTGPWLYLGFIFPLLTIPLYDLRIYKRALYIVVLGLAWPASYFLPNLDYLQYEFISVPLVYHSSLCVGSVLLGHLFHNIYRQNYFQSKELERERKKSDTLLKNILPPSIVKRLRDDSDRDVAEKYESVTVIFLDLVDFSTLANQYEPDRVVDVLDDIFSMFDRIVRRNGLEKIKTIGDEYMCVSGLPDPRQDHLVTGARTALELQQQLHNYERPDGGTFKSRLGIHTGPCTAGIIGLDKFTYDLWGRTVNLASRMEQNGIPGEIQVTPSVRQRLEEQNDDHDFWLKERGKISVEGEGRLTTYFLRESEGND
jgi:class 3 adenylate cyclase